MIDYALKPPASQQEINIEKINNTNDYLMTMNPDEQKIFEKSYKYPYLAGEILSHDYPFLLDKIIKLFTINISKCLVFQAKLLNLYQKKIKIKMIQ